MAESSVPKKRGRPRKKPVQSKVQPTKKAKPNIFMSVIEQTSIGSFIKKIVIIALIILINLLVSSFFEDSFDVFYKILGIEVIVIFIAFWIMSYVQINQSKQEQAEHQITENED